MPAMSQRAVVGSAVAAGAFAALALIFILSGADVADLSNAISATTTYTLKVDVRGGSVTITPLRPAGASHDCSEPCSITFSAGAVLSVAPTRAGSAVQWSGPCTGTGACSLTLKSNTALGATFAAAAPSAALTVASPTATPTQVPTATPTPAPTATPTPAPTPSPAPVQLTVSCESHIGIVSQPAGINCQSTATQAASTTFAWPPGTAVSLTAVLDGLSEDYIVQWPNLPTCSSGPSCVVTVQSQHIFVNAHVSVKPALVVKITGSGRVTSVPAGIDCDSSVANSSGCRARFDPGSAVTLTSARVGAVIRTWAGPCTAVPCVVTMGPVPSSDVTATATFDQWPTLSVTNTASAAPVTMTTDPVGAGPRGDQYPPNSQVMVTITPGKATLASQWVSPTGCVGTTCVVTVGDLNSTTQAKFFAAPWRPLQVIVQGPGTVTDDTGVINCVQSTSTDGCYDLFPGSATLTAQPQPGMYFTHWCCGTQITCSQNPVCHVTWTGSTTFAVNAIFEFPYVVYVTVTGDGSVTGEGGINCSQGGGTCTASFSPGSLFHLTPIQGATRSYFSSDSDYCDNVGCGLRLGGDFSSVSTHAVYINVRFVAY